MKRRIYNFGSSAAMVKKSSVLGVAAVLLGVGGIIITGSNSAEQAGALSYQTSVTNSFEILPSVSITFDKNIKDLVINDLTPGGAADSNTITLTVETNNSTGYTVSSTVGDGTTYQNANLVHKDAGVADVFTSLGTSDTVTNLEDIDAGKWGYNFSLNGGAWQGYSGLPYSTLVEGVYTPTPALLVDTGSAADKTASSTIDFKIAASSSDTQAAGEYSNVINFITTVYPSDGGGDDGGSSNPTCTNTIAGITYMQDINSSNSAEILDSLDTTKEYVLKDKRDKKAYCVAKLPDGNLWMTQNLDHNIVTDGSVTYDNTTTDLGWNSSKGSYDTASWTPDKSTYATGTTTWAADNTAGKNIQESYDPGDLCWDGKVYTSGAQLADRTSECTNESNYHYHVGNYYNWTAAVAMNDSSSYTTQNADVDQSICPTGWRLPIGGTTNTGSKSFYYLVNGRYTSGTSGTIHQAAPYFTYGGYWRGSAAGNVGYNGNYWSSVVNSATYGYFMAFDGNGNLYLQDYYSRYNGYSVRCVAR